MKLVERISQQNSAAPAPFQRSLIGGAPKRAPKDAQAEGFQQLKLAVHNRLFETLDVTRLESLEPVLAAQKVTEAISAILDDEGRLLTDVDKTHLIEEIKNELLGLGPLEPLLWDDEITDILVNGHNQVYVEKRGKLHATDVKFQDDQHLMLIIDRIVSQVGRRVDEASPMVDARLPDGSRINAIIPPLALDGPSLSIRRFGRKRYNIDDLVEKKTLVPEIVEFMRTVVRARLNILICGGTGSGKTTMLNCMSLFVPADERIVTIEDGRIDAPAAACGQARDAAAQRRRQGRSQPARPGQKLAAYAARPHNRRRGPRRRSVRHVTGDVDRTLKSGKITGPADPLETLGGPGKSR